MGYPESENTWEPKQNINPRLVEQFDADHGGALTGPPPKDPKTPKTPKAVGRPPSTTTASSQRGRTRGPPKQREEVRKCFQLVGIYFVPNLSNHQYQRPSSPNSRWRCSIRN